MRTLVMGLVLLLEAAQDRDRVLDRRLGDEHRLEAPRQRRVLFDMLAIFVERGRADAMQFAARQRRLEQVRSVHRPVRLAGPDEGMHLVDEQDDAASGGGDLVEHALQALLELAAIFRARDQRAHVEREQLLVADRFRHVAVDDAQSQALDDRRLADAGLANQTGLFLVRRDSTCTVRRISSSRPITGSSLPVLRAASVRSRVYFLSASY